MSVGVLMKKSEMIEHIAAEMSDAYHNRQLSRETEDAYWQRKATNLLDMLLGFGMLPPARKATTKDRGLEDDPDLFAESMLFDPTVNEWEPE